VEIIIPANTARPRYRQLDSLRGLAALSVFFTHFISMKITLPWLRVLQQSPLGILFNGNAAVMLFFVLSGFVLSLPFVDHKKPLKFGDFYLRRVFRIYPAYIFAILFALLLKEIVFYKNGLLPYADWMNNFWAWNWSTQSSTEIAKTLLLIGPDFNINYIDPPIWSMVIEMKMSIILPFFILVVSKGGKPLNIALLLVMAWLTYQYNAWPMGIFYLGLLMAKYKDQVIGVIRRLPWETVTALVVVSILFYNINYELFHVYPKLNFASKYTISNYISAIGSGIIIVIVLAKENISSFFERRFFTFFGDISYSFYLIHLPLLLTMCSIFSNLFALSPLYIFISAFALATTIAYLMAIYIEKPFQKIALRLTKRRYNHPSQLNQPNPTQST
jgi:peptidoglycan/LPS O-acetylase OafA/YrhL